jgi:hypothetical protein
MLYCAMPQLPCCYPKETLVAWKLARADFTCICAHLVAQSNPHCTSCLSTITCRGQAIVKSPPQSSSAGLLLVYVKYTISAWLHNLFLPTPFTSIGGCITAPIPQGSVIVSGPSQESETCREQICLTAARRISRSRAPQSAPASLDLATVCCLFPSCLNTGERCKHSATTYC